MAGLSGTALVLGRGSASNAEGLDVSAGGACVGVYSGAVLASATRFPLFALPAAEEGADTAPGTEALDPTIRGATGAAVRAAATAACFAALSVSRRTVAAMDEAGTLRFGASGPANGAGSAGSLAVDDFIADLTSTEYTETMLPTRHAPS